MSKYHAVRTTIDGVTFPSKREASRYSELMLLVRSGIIRDLELQPRFPIVVNGAKICTYVADFRYKDLDGRVTIEDSKGVKTPVYVIKRKLVEAIYNVRIIEV